MEGEGMRAKSFRYEDYNTRRVFLRSYPLNFGEEESQAEEQKPEAGEKSKGASKHNKKEEEAGAATKVTKIILAFVQWGEERVLVFRRFKHKITIYVVNCVPITLKAPTALISAKS